VTTTASAAAGAARVERLERDALLIVDDEDAVCFALQAYFGVRGFTVDVAATLAEAMERVEHGRYAAVIADLRLTGSDGVEGLALLRHVRATSPTLPFVLVTGFGTAAVAAEAQRLGVSALLIKPQPLTELARVVDGLLALRD
jgi:DNA-binding NtrC family response regulator